MATVQGKSSSSLSALNPQLHFQVAPLWLLVGHLKLPRSTGRQLRPQQFASLEAANVRNEHSLMYSSYFLQTQVLGLQVDDLSVHVALLEIGPQGPEVCHSLSNPCLTYLSIA